MSQKRVQIGRPVVVEVLKDVVLTCRVEIDRLMAAEDEVDIVHEGWLQQRFACGDKSWIRA
jgi:hypothetical protein